jgi:hypothetical protein
MSVSGFAPTPLPAPVESRVPGFGEYPRQQWFHRPLGVAETGEF